MKKIMGKNGSYRVGRGGCWDFSARFCRSANRYSYVPGARKIRLGFRPARNIKENSDEEDNR